MKDLLTNSLKYDYVKKVRKCVLYCATSNRRKFTY